MKIVLHTVSTALTAATNQALSYITTLLQKDYPEISVEHLGSSSWEGSLSKGDIDVLVKVSEPSFEPLVATLSNLGTGAQPENWTETFASFTLQTTGTQEVGVQLVATGSGDEVEFTRHTKAMKDLSFRERYDLAKQHGSTLGPDGYRRVKDVFWQTFEQSGPKWTMPKAPILKILRPDEWRLLQEQETTPGAPIDVQDGYIHFSTSEQVEETVAKHFKGESELWLLTLDAEALGDSLKWEPSRGGALFPHLYGPLQLKDVCLVRPWG